MPIFEGKLWVFISCLSEIKIVNVLYLFFILALFTACFYHFFVLEIIKLKYDKVFIKHSASISKFEWFEQVCLEEKSSFKMLGLTLSSKLDWGSYIISIAKTASKKIGVLIRSMKFLSPEVALYLYKSTICPCVEYCCHIWAGAPSCYLELLDKLQKWICRTVGPSHAPSLESLADCQNVASLSLFYKYYFGRCSSELA